MQKLLLIDANSLIHRAFHGIRSDLKTRQGQSTNAIYGFFSMLFSVLKSEKPDLLTLAFDSKEKTFRHTMFTEYKGTRQKAPDELYTQLNIIKNTLEENNFASINMPGFEADDIIGSMSKKYCNDLTVTILTGDQDSFQLVKENVFVAYLINGVSNLISYDKNKIYEKTGFYPEQIVDYKALCGDKSDNIPGVPNIGPKKASILLTKFGTIEGIYEKINEVDPKLKPLLVEHKENAILSKKLAQINQDLEINISSDLMDIKNINIHNLESFFKQYECESLIRKMDFLKTNDQKENQQASLF